MYTPKFPVDSECCVAWTGSAGILIKHRSLTILIDPTFSSQNDNPLVCADTGLPLLNAYPFSPDSFEKIDFIFYTHSDRDHMGPVTAQKLIPKTEAVFGSNFVKNRLEQYNASTEKFNVCKCGDTISLPEGLSVTVLAADHPWQEQNPNKFGPAFGTNDCLGFILHTVKGNFLVSGDTRRMSQHDDLGKIDLIFLDISDDPYHLGQKDAIWLANRYPNARIIPIHYGTYAVNKPAYNSQPDDVIPFIGCASERFISSFPGKIINL